MDRCLLMESTSDSKVYSGASRPLILHNYSGQSSRREGFIEHIVSKFDTLAGVAIKYGVEVSDIKRANGLTNDLQMFARKLLKIPLPGRHPPSSVMSNGYHTQGETSTKMTLPNRRYTDSFTPTKTLKLSSITSLRDYYALPANDQKTITEDYKPTQPNSLSGHHRKSKSEANWFSKISKTNNVNIPIANDKSIEKSVRRRKSDVDQDSASQPKLVNPATPESEPFTPNSIPLTGVRKSSSAPVFLQSETTIDNSSPTPSSIWPISMLNFTADFQAMSILFDGLPKPTSGRKKKAARD